MASSRSSRRQIEKPPLLRWLGANAPIVIFLTAAFAGMLFAYLTFNPSVGDAAVVTAVLEDGSGLFAPISKVIQERRVRQRLRQSLGPIRIALISGHLESDSGAICEDGLAEAQVNINITRKVEALLVDAGINVEIYNEFDPRLQGYSGTALVSIHADSCEELGPQATGFKIAGSGVTDSSSLTICVQGNYATATGLPYHADTITPHMTDYHAFRLIAPGTPALILETGFLNQNRELLTVGAEVPAQGIADGIFCFLKEIRP